jgi:hypothetical protein
LRENRFVSNRQAWSFFGLVSGEIFLEWTLFLRKTSPEEIQEGLFDAAEKGHLHVVQFLDSSGADIFKQKCGIISLIKPACQSGNQELFLYLVNRGVPVVLLGETDGAIDGAVEGNHPKLLTHLLENYTMPKSHRRMYGFRVLDEAVTKGYLEVLEIILQAELGRHYLIPMMLSSPRYELYPLYTAVKIGNLQTIRILLSYIERPGNDELDETIQLAQSKDRSDIVNYLIQYKVAHPSLW